MKKRILISLLLSIILIIVLTGCSGVIGPKTAKLDITIVPNPVPYNSEDGRWWFNLILTESNGVGVTLISLRIDAYDQAEELVDVQILDEEDITDWFESNYLPAFSTLSNWIWHTGTSKYNILTIAGVDDNDNPIEATERVDYLPK